MWIRYFYGWNVVAATFVIGLGAFGVGFYAITVYLAALQRLHGWTASAVSAPVTMYYVAGALLSAWIADAYERFGPRVVVAMGSLAMAAGLALLAVVTQPWHLYLVFLVMAIGWGAMSGAALNILIAPWFERQRGLAVSLAFNGATLGGVIIAPTVLLLIERVGFARALTAAAAALLIVLLPIAALVLRSGPATLGVGPDGDPPRAAPARRTDVTRSGRGAAVRTWRFWSVSAPFALGLAAQVGVLTHLVSIVGPALGVGGAARAVSMTTAAAVVGRLATGVVIDRMNRRLAAAATLGVQIAGVALLALSGARGESSPAALYAGCALFGLGVGNMTTLPGLIVATEWPREQFSALVALVVGINQFTFAFGPSLVGVMKDATGDYAPALGLCIGLQIVAIVIVLRGPGADRHARGP